MPVLDTRIHDLSQRAFQLGCRIKSGNDEDGITWF